MAKRKAIWVALMLALLVGCGNDKSTGPSVQNYIDQGKLSLALEEYDQAEEAFLDALAKESENE